MLVAGVQVRWYSFQFVLAQLVDELSDMHNAIVRTCACLPDCCRVKILLCSCRVCCVEVPGAGVRRALDGMLHPPTDSCSVAQARLLVKFPHTAMAKPQSATTTPGSTQHGRSSSGSGYMPLLTEDLPPGIQRQASV